MTQDYFIVTGKTRSGPYDLVMLVRKIRNGSLNSSTLIQKEESVPAKPASEWHELVTFLTDSKEERKEVVKSNTLKMRGLGMALQGGWRFLQQNQISTVLGGVWVMCIIAMIAVTQLIHVLWIKAFAYIFCFIFSHFLLSCYLFTVLRMTRGQPFGISYMMEKIMPSIEPLLFSSAYISITAVIGLVIFTGADSIEKSILGLLIVAIPGFIILTLYMFTSLIILDQGHGLWQSMEMSRKAVLKSGVENIGVLYALFVINFIAGLGIILPMAISLPITMRALAEIYDESFV